MQTIRITTSQNIDIEYEIAGPGERIIGYLADMSIFVISYITIIIFLLKNQLNGGTGMAAYGVAIIVWVIVLAFYDLVCEVFFNGQSIGKKIMKTRVISIDGTQPSLGQYLLRWLFRIVDFSVTLGMGGLISMLVTENRQRIGDLVAGTAVVKTVPRTSIEDIAFIPPSETYEPVFPEASNLRDKDIILIHEVLQNFKLNDNHPLVHDTAERVKEHLNIQVRNMDDLTFLETVVKDYNYIAASTTDPLNEIHGKE